MNWDRIEGNWKQLKGKVKEQWGKLTDDELDQAQGRADQMVGLLQQRYGYTKDLPFERVYRESRTYRIEDGTDEIQKINLVRGYRKGWRP